ncbi:GntR family transcriptional regulator [Streptosporangium sp. NPDC049248]|uniref:GntR family transcriptional regulator n=1 Tax=Streptosporangium sp. NPDC049248 TaxID=3155651 RepID=UPI00342523F8
MRYRQIADELRDLIATGAYPPGSTLPSQAELLATFNTSTATLASATRILSDEGLISRNVVRGRLVVQDLRPVYVDLALAIPPGNGQGPWQTACQRAGRTGTMHATSVTRVPADRDVAQALQISIGTTVVRRDRRAALDDQDVMLDTAYYPLAVVEDTPVAGTSTVVGGVWAALIAAGILDPVTARVRELIGSRTATKDEVEALRLRAGASVLTAERVTRDGEARPVELLHRVANERRVRFKADNMPLTQLP